MNLTESQISSELLYDGSFIAISRDKVDDIRKLNARIKEIVAREGKLRTSIDRIVADLEGTGK